MHANDFAATFAAIVNDGFTATLSTRFSVTFSATFSSTLRVSFTATASSLKLSSPRGVTWRKAVATREMDKKTVCNGII